MARIAFCQNIMVEFMGFMHMSAVLKEAGHEVEVFINDSRRVDSFAETVGAYNPDIVGLSVLTPTLSWALGFVQILKERSNAVTVFGNAHAIICPDIVLEPNVDIVCRTEGEMPLLALANRVDRQESYDDVEGLWIKTSQGIAKNPNPVTLLDLDRMPLHDRGLYDKYAFFRRSHYLRFLLGRGCPFRCSFCSNRFFLDHYAGSKYVRKRNPQALVNEIEDLVRRRRPKHVYFVDEVFWVSREWLREFLSLYRTRIGIPFSANVPPTNVQEEDIRLLADASCRQVILAVETGDENERKNFLNKSAKNSEILRVSRWLHKYKIEFNCNVLFGLPWDRVDQHIGRLAFFRDLAPAYLWTAFFQPYPGLELSEREEVKRCIPPVREFEQTCHNDMFLDHWDRVRLVNLKKIYFLLMLWPTWVPLFRRLIRYRITPLFDLLFLCHFTYYIFKFEHVSLLQYLYHLKVFALNPLTDKMHSLHHRQRDSKRG